MRAGALVLDAARAAAHDAEARGDDAARVAGVHALGEQLDLEVAADEPAQRRRRPQLVVVAAARVEADDEARLADARREVLDVGGQVVAAALLAGLDQDDAARVRDALLAAAASIAVSDAKIA